jgi:hypothetical protein
LNKRQLAHGLIVVPAESIAPAESGGFPRIRRLLC